MSSDVVVIASIGAQNPAQMRHTQDDEMIHALALDRSDQPFGKAILPGRAWCSRFVPDAHRAQSACNDGAIDREARVVPRASCVRPKGSGVHARACNRFTLLPLNPAGNPAIVSRYEPGIISRANVFQPLRTCESRLRLTLAATQIKSAPALSRSGSLSVYSIGFYSMI